VLSTHRTRASVSAIILFCCWATSPAGGAPLSNVLRVSLTAAPTALRVGEALALSAVIENVSARSVTIHSRRSVYTAGDLKVYDDLGVQLDGFRTAIFALTPPSAADFTTLNPGERFVIRVTEDSKTASCMMLRLRVMRDYAKDCFSTLRTRPFNFLPLGPTTLTSRSRRVESGASRRSVFSH